MITATAHATANTVAQHVPSLTNMLASLFRGSTGQRTSQHIESVTDDAHTRSLLFGHAQQVFNLTTSPPPSPFGSPPVRGGSFDDRSGFELEERDIRVLLAQDVYSGEERPKLLFDSRKPQDTSFSHNERHDPTRSPLPPNWRSSQGFRDRHDDHLRNRSSTFSESQSSWSKVNRDVTSKDDPFLECMFGVTSSTKMSNSTKLHVVPAKNRQSNASERLPKRATETRELGKRGALARSHTSGNQPTLSALDLDNRDAVLVTRLFHVALDENMKIVNTKENAVSMDGQQQPAKLVERKAPAYAVGLVIQLPSSSSSNRPQSSHFGMPRSASYGHSFTSVTSSFGSDMQSSWTFLDAIPTSLSSSITVGDESDRRLDVIVENWDVILRSVSAFERVAAHLVDQELQKVIRFESDAQTKLTRRDNQRIVGISDHGFVAQSSLLKSAANDVARRIVYAIRIPRVLTGIGFVAGHWTDEARMLHRVCGGRQQNFFLFNLLTAFLGSNVQWLERLAPEWYRKQYLESHKRSPEINTLASRTIVVSEHKGLARRLIYILASFLPSQDGTDGLRQSQEDTGLSGSFSPSRRFHHNQSRRPSKPYIKEATLPRDPSCDLLSTSASSRLSQGSVIMNSSPRKQMVRKDSNRFDIGGGGIRTMLDGSAGTSSAVVPHAVETPTAYLSVRDSYFPESAIVETNDSVATADLSRVLNRASSTHRRTSSASSRWGSLVSGLSEMWSNRQSSSIDRSSVTTMSQGASPAPEHKRAASAALSINRASNPLQMMVDELDQGRLASIGYRNGSSSAVPSSPHRRQSRMMTSAPRLQVDEKDGVIDVEIDLPGFVSATKFGPSTDSTSKPTNNPLAFNHGIASSVSSLRSMAGRTSRYTTSGSLNVGGFLRRHHEDFVLHAVRPYNDLHEDIRRSMRAEPTPQDMLDQMLRESSLMVWISICTTLVADTRGYSIQRFTLRRQYEVPAPDIMDGRPVLEASAYRRARLIMRHEEIAEDKVMEFDATLADAIEKLLNVGPNDITKSAPSTRTHQRNVSTGSERVDRLGVSDPRYPTPSKARQDPSKIEQRDLVVGALEDVIRSVNAGLTKKSTGQLRTDEVTRRGNSPRQENALREGVRKWMIDVEHNSHTVW